MANTYGSLAGILVLQEILETLLVKFPILKQITRDFSAQQAKLNQQITSRVVVAGTAVAFDSAVGYTAANRTTVDVPLTINTHVHHTFEVTDVEQSQTNRDLRGELVKTASHALGTKVVGDLFAVVLAANYRQSYSRSAANFGRFDIRKIKTQLNKLLLPPDDRFIVLNSDYAEGPDLDTVVVANPSGFNPGGIAVKTNVFPMIDGFEISEFATLPDNGEKLGGIAGVKEALLMAARVPDIPADPTEIPGTIRVVSEPNTMLTIQQRRFYDMKLGKLVESVVVMYGFNVGLSNTGVSDRLVRVVGP